MSTEQHETLKLADWLAGMVCIHPQVSEDDPGGYATEYDQKVDEGRLTILVQHALIAQMAEALSELAELMEATRTGDYAPDSFTNQPANHAIAAATQYLTNGR